MTDAGLEKRERRVPGQMVFVGLTLALLACAGVFWIGYRRWWRDPDGVAWTFFLVALVIGLAMLAMLVVSFIGVATGGGEWPSLRGLLAGATLLSLSIPLAVVAGIGVGLSGFSCSGGVIGEGCSGGAPLAGLAVGGGILAAAGWLAWFIARPD